MGGDECLLVLRFELFGEADYGAHEEEAHREKVLGLVQFGELLEAIFPENVPVERFNFDSVGADKNEAREGVGKLLLVDVLELMLREVVKESFILAVFFCLVDLFVLDLGEGAEAEVKRGGGVLVSSGGEMSVWEVLEGDSGERRLELGTNFRLPDEQAVAGLDDFEQVVEEDLSDVGDVAVRVDEEDAGADEAVELADDFLDGVVVPLDILVRGKLSDEVGEDGLEELHLDEIGEREVVVTDLVEVDAPGEAEHLLAEVAVEEVDLFGVLLGRCREELAAEFHDDGGFGGVFGASDDEGAVTSFVLFEPFLEFAEGLFVVFVPEDAGLLLPALGDELDIEEVFVLFDYEEDDPGRVFTEDDFNLLLVLEKSIDQDIGFLVALDFQALFRES